MSLEGKQGNPGSGRAEDLHPLSLCALMTLLKAMLPTAV